MELTLCPECESPAEIEQRHVLESTDWPIEHVKIRCVSRHWFFLPVAALSRPCGAPAEAVPGARSPRAGTRQ
jgi:hypothetical protein